jgi:LCP family protein required for cell wall assembly
MVKSKSLFQSKGVRTAAILLVAIFIVLSGVLAYSFARGIASAGPLGIQSFFPSLLTETPTVAIEGEINSTAPAADAIEQAIPAAQPWDGAGRVTVLLVGLDYRDWDAGEKYSRSDSMMLLTLDPLTKTAGVLSIPRDMWVAIPGFEHGKINTAYYLGDAYKLPGGGPGLAIQTVEEFLGIPINYYAQIDFQAFEDFIDELGGVRVVVPEKITIDKLGDGAKTIKKLRPGEHILTGPWALAYARARYTEGGDFDRAQRQQQVLLGIREKVFSAEMLPTLIRKAPEIYQELSAGIRTNLSLDEVIRLALLAQQVTDDNIQRGVIGKEYVLFGFSPDDLSILVPLPDKIQMLVDQVFNTGSSQGPVTAGDLITQLASEAASLGISNGSTLPGFAGRTGDYLRSQGVNVAQVSETAEPTFTTTVIDHTGNPYLMKYLIETLQINPNRVYSRFDPNSPYAVELILGEDLAKSGIVP